MLLDSNACYRAVRARDTRFDGRFYVAVATTRIYCRPICPVRPPKRENMRFYSSAAAAEGAGFRPCLRCRPERAPGLAPVDAVSRLVGAAMAGIEEHALSSAHVGELAATLGISDRHLRRVTQSELGVSPIELAQTQRLLSRQTPAPGNLAQPDRDRIRQRLRQRAPLQCAVQIPLWIEPARDSRQSERRRDLECAIGIPAAICLGSTARLFAIARHPRRGNGRCDALSAHRCHRRCLRDGSRSRCTRAAAP